MSDMNQPPPPPPPPPGGGTPPPPPGGTTPPPPPPPPGGGTPPPPPGGPVPGAPSPFPKNWMGITALIAGIVGFLLICCGGLGFLPGVGGVVLGILGRKAAQEGEANNGGMATAGLILGGVAVLLNVVWFILSVVLSVADGFI